MFRRTVDRASLGDSDMVRAGLRDSVMLSNSASLRDDVVRCEGAGLRDGSMGGDGASLGDHVVLGEGAGFRDGSVVGDRASLCDGVVLSDGACLRDGSVISDSASFRCLGEFRAGDGICDGHILVDSTGDGDGRGFPSISVPTFSNGRCRGEARGEHNCQEGESHSDDGER